MFQLIGVQIDIDNWTIFSWISLTSFSFCNGYMARQLFTSNRT